MHSTIRKTVQVSSKFCIRVTGRSRFAANKRAQPFVVQRDSQTTFCPTEFTDAFFWLAKRAERRNVLARKMRQYAT
jgi:hypothetical protein